MVSPFFEKQLFNNHPKTDGPMGYNWHGNSMKTKSLVLLAVGLLVMSGCGKKIEYRVDGPTPQEKYSVEMSKTIICNGWNPARGVVEELIVPAGPRPKIIERLLIGQMYSDGICCGDTYYEFGNANEKMGCRIKFDEPVVPDYNILVRDMLKYGGVTEEIAYVDAYQLVIVDSSVFAKKTDPYYRFANPGTDAAYYDGNRYYYYKQDAIKDVKGKPDRMYAFMSVLRYWYGIHVFADNNIPTGLPIFLDDDFYTQEIDFDVVNKMLQEKYGLKMVPADKQMKVVTYSVNK